MTNPSLQWTVPPFLEDLKVSSYLLCFIMLVLGVGNSQVNLVFCLFVLCCLYFFYCLKFYYCVNARELHWYCRFKVDRLQIIVVAKNKIVLQLFISRMPKMCAIPQLVSAPLMLGASISTVSGMKYSPNLLVRKKLLSLKLMQSSLVLTLNHVPLN